MEVYKVTCMKPFSLKDVEVAQRCRSRLFVQLCQCWRHGLSDFVECLCFFVYGLKPEVWGRVLTTPGHLLWDLMIERKRTRTSTNLKRPPSRMGPMKYSGLLGFSGQIAVIEYTEVFSKLGHGQFIIPISFCHISSSNILLIWKEFHATLILHEIMHSFQMLRSRIILFHSDL